MNPIGDLLANILSAFYVLFIIFVPFIAFYVLFRYWMRYIRTEYHSTHPHIVLEIRLPKEIMKSPAAMEIFFTALYQTGAATVLETYWQGKTRPIFSCELASIEGKVKFFIWTRAAFKNIVEAQIYAQYPNVEIYEVPDYTTLIQHGRNNMNMWGTYFKKKMPDVYPIKSYIDYGLDADPKEEYKIDPMTSVLEYLGSLGKDEHAWIQIIIQAHKEEGWKEGRLLSARKGYWKNDVIEEIKKIKEETQKSAAVAGSPLSRLSKGQELMVAALERNMTKWPFECCIRGFYFAKNDNFNANLGITGLIGSFRQYSSADLNNIALGWFTDHQDTGKDILTLLGWFPPFRNYMRHRRDKMERHMLNAYKDRGAFEDPYTDHQEPFIMTTEELATIYHFPGDVAATPTFDRILAKKAEAPSNLPI